MGLFRASSPVAVRSSAADPVRVQPAGKPASLWQDGFGSLAIRSLQIILVVAVAAGLLIGLRELTVVVIPLLLALILACAFAPVMAWLRRRGVPLFDQGIVAPDAVRLDQTSAVKPTPSAPAPRWGRE